MAKKTQAVSSAVRSRLDKSWKSVGKEKPLSFADGDTIIGVLRKLEEKRGANSAIAVIETEDGLKRYWAPTILADLLSNVPVGHEVRIECLGKTVETARGQNAWGFNVDMRERG